MGEQDRRQDVRHKIDLEVAVVTDQAYSVAATMKEISPTGIRIRTVKVVMPGTQVALFLKLENEIQIRGKVLWTLCEVDKGLNVYLLGIHTDAIVWENLTATEYADKAELVQEILYAVKEQEQDP